MLFLTSKRQEVTREMTLTLSVFSKAADAVTAARQAKGQAQSRMRPSGRAAVGVNGVHEG